MSVVMLASEEIRGGTALPLRCNECRAEVRLVLPLPVGDLASMLRAYDDAHAECVLDKAEEEER